MSASTGFYGRISVIGLMCSSSPHVNAPSSVITRVPALLAAGTVFISGAVGKATPRVASTRDSQRGGFGMGSVEGKMDKGKGRVKQAAGDLTDNESLKREGRADRVGGAVKETARDAADKVEETVDRVKDKLTRD
jgi:uncharacterized protein YjbJ (UPF0337 family)